MVNGEAGPATWRLLEVSRPSAFANLAVEEALARSHVGPSLPVIRMWRNPPAAIVGRFQEISAEVDVELCRKNNIAIARRFTGGGAVYHDLGNLNLTLVTQRPLGVPLREMHKKNSSIILDLLAHLGLEGVFVPPNSINVGQRKIAGAAAALGQSFALWHASILVSTDTLVLQHVLAPSRQLIQTSSIRSNWRPVTTLAEVLGGEIEVDNIQQELLKSCVRMVSPRIEKSGFLDTEERYSRSLYERKYSLPHWNLNRDWFEDELERKSEGTHTTIAV